MPIQSTITHLQSANGTTEGHATILTAARAIATEIAGDATASASLGLNNFKAAGLDVVGSNLVFTDVEGNTVDEPTANLVSGLDPSNLDWSSLSGPAATAIAAALPADSVDPAEIDFGNISAADVTSIMQSVADNGIDPDKVDWGSLSAADIASIKAVVDSDTTNSTLAVVGGNLVLTDSQSSTVQVATADLINNLDPSGFDWASLTPAAANALASAFPADALDPSKMNFANMTLADANEVANKFGDDALDPDDVDWSALNATDVTALRVSLGIGAAAMATSIAGDAGALSTLTNAVVNAIVGSVAFREALAAGLISADTGNSIRAGTTDKRLFENDGIPA
jgi:hypothetical protein